MSQMTTVELRTLAAAQIVANLSSGVPRHAGDGVIKEIAEFAVKLAAAVEDAARRSLNA